MAEIKTVYKGEFTDRRTEKLRQILSAIRRLEEVGCSINDKEAEADRNHEMAHVVGHEPGRKGRIRAHVLVSNNNKILGWGVEHDMTLEEKLKMRPGEQTRASLAPAFVKNKHISRLNMVDMFAAGIGVVTTGIDKILEKKSRK